MVDAHAHLVSPERAAANRVAGGPPSIDQPTALADLLALQPWPMSMILVESNRPHAGENYNLLEVAEADAVLGVIGRLDFHGQDPVSEFQSLLAHPNASKWRGVRMSMLPAHGDGWSAKVKDLTAALGETDRVLEILASGQALAAVAEISRVAQCTVVLDHLGLPPWTGPDDEWQMWRAEMIRLADTTSIFCKWSALPALGSAGQEARADEATDLALDAFGPARLMYASNMPWPPGLTDLDDSYPVKRAVATASTLAADESKALLGGTCRLAYGIQQTP